MSRSERKSRNAKARVARESRKDKILIKILTASVITLLVSIIMVAISYAIYNHYQQNKFIQEAEKEIQQNIENERKKEEEENKEKQETDATFTLAAIGDIMCENSQCEDAYIENTGEYDFSYVFENVKNHIKTADLAIGNLKTNFAGDEKGFNNKKVINAPDKLAFNLKKLGLDIITTAGNHSLNTGIDNLSRTIDILNQRDLAHLGTYQTQEEKDKVFIKYTKGVKIAFINYTYGTNEKVPEGQEFCINIIDKEKIKQELEKAKQENPDIIVSYMSWGKEYASTPNEEQKDLTEFLFQNGVDIILGSNPHVLQPMEKRTITLEDGSQKDGFVAYSLGNFMSNQNNENTKSSIILNLTVTKHLDGKITIDKTDYIPICMGTAKDAKTKKMKLVDINKIIDKYEEGANEAIDEKTYNNAKAQLEKIKTAVGM